MHSDTVARLGLPSGGEFGSGEASGRVGIEGIGIAGQQLSQFGEPTDHRPPIGRRSGVEPMHHGVHELIVGPR